MRDELIERLSFAVSPHTRDVSSETGEAVLKALEAFMDENRLKMMAEPIKDRRHYLAKKWWDAAPLMPWEG